MIMIRDRMRTRIELSLNIGLSYTRLYSQAIHTTCLN
jgi:hypothetical protein